MKKMLLYLIPAATAWGQQPESEFPETAPSFEEISIPSDGKMKIPAHSRVRLRGVCTGKGKLTHGSTQFLFSDDDITYSYIFPVPGDNILSLSLGYQYSLFQQTPNLFSKQESFHNGFAAVGWQNNYFKDFTFQTECSVYCNLQKREESSTLFYAVGYGRYAITPCWGLALGAIYRSGIESTRAWPIAGFDWKITEHWDVHLIVPIDMAFIYHLNKCWSFSFNGKLLNNRQRLKEEDFLPSGFIEYQNVGIEFDITYEWNYIVFAQIGGGYLIAGKVKTRHYDHHQEGVPFLNAQFALRF